MNQFDQQLENLECPDCASTESTCSCETQRFEYGQGPGSVVLSCTVPVYTCAVCNAHWTGPEAEDIRQEAVCRHLGRLTPREIRSIRDAYGLSQAEFSRLTGFGEASLSRWETGIQVQNASSDRLLRLVRADASNLLRLQDLERDGAVETPKFKVIEITPELRRRARRFSLRRAS